MTDIEKLYLDAMKSGGACRMVLYNPRRETERDLKFELDPGDSQDADVAQQILDQVQGYVVQKVYVDGRLVWEKPAASGRKVICFDHDKVKVSY